MAPPAGAVTTPRPAAARSAGERLQRPGSRQSAAADHGRELVTQADLAAHRAEVRADLTALELRLIKWIVGTGVAVAGAVLAGLRLLLP